MQNSQYLVGGAMPRGEHHLERLMDDLILAGWLATADIDKKPTGTMTVHTVERSLRRTLAECMMSPSSAVVAFTADAANTDDVICPDDQYIAEKVLEEAADIVMRAAADFEH